MNWGILSTLSEKRNSAYTCTQLSTIAVKGRVRFKHIGVYSGEIEHNMI